MEDLFRSYWWLLFPLGWFVSIGFGSLLNYFRQRETLRLIRTYAEKGQEPPDALLKILDRPTGSDVHSGSYGAEAWGSSGPVFTLVLFTILAAGFGYASYADVYGAGDAFLIVALVMGAVAAATLVSLLIGRSRQGWCRLVGDRGMDAELVAAARAGSDAAFARLVQRHQAPVRAFLRRTLGGRFDLADDLAQEVFVVAWGSLRHLKDPAGVRSWLFGIAWRRAQDAMRSGLRGQARDRAWIEAEAPQGGISPDDRIALERAMAELPTDQRACVALCLADGWSHSEAAAALSLPLGTVKSHVNRGRARLLAALTGGSDEP